MSDPTRLEAASYRAAAPNTIGGLHRALKPRLAALLESWWGATTKTTARVPQLIDGWLSPKTPPVAGVPPTLTSEQFPFIILRPRHGVDDAQSGESSSSMIEELLIGMFLDAEDGWLDVLDLIQAIRLDLAAAPVLKGTAFEHTGPLTWELLEEQARPQWFGKITTIWTLPRLQRTDTLGNTGG